LSGQPRDVAESRAEIEHAQARTDAGSTKEQSGCRFEPGRLVVQPDQFLRVAAEHVGVFAFH
jgi:hypothetical protein